MNVPRSICIFNRIAIAVCAVGTACSLESAAQTANDWKVEAWETVDLVLTPAPISDESLELTLFDDSQLSSHNAATFYYRASLKWAAMSKSHRAQLYKKRQAWFDAPIKELPTVEVEQWLEQTAAVSKELDMGLKAQCDWGISTRELTYGQQADMDFSAEQAIFGEFGDILKLRARLNAANGEFKEVTRSLADCFKLARDVGKLPIGSFAANISSSIAFPALEMVNEISELPGCPNFYSALQTIPRPIANYLSEIKRRHEVIGRSFPILDDPVGSDRTEQQWRQAYLDSMEQLGRAHDWKIERDYPNGWDEWIASNEKKLSVLFAKNYPLAKRELIKAGWDRKKLDAMPVGQVIAIQTKRVWDAYTNLFNGIENMPAEAIHDRSVKIDNSDLVFGELHGCFPLNLITISQENLLRSRWQLVELSLNVQLLRDFLARTGELPNPEQFKALNPLPDQDSGLPFQYRLLSSGDAQLQAVPGSYEGYDPNGRNDYTRIRYIIRKVIQK